jgi:hypothetical protein
VSAFAGSSGVAGYCDGARALLNGASGAAYSAGAGALVVADTGGNCLRSFAPSGFASTLAGACGSAGGFADGLLDERELDDLLKQCVRDLPAPDAVIELRCNLGTRTERIQQRIPDYAGSIDSIDPDRARLHRLALTRIASQWNRPWLVLETTTMNQHQVFDAAKEWVTAQGGSAR